MSSISYGRIGYAKADPRTPDYGRTASGYGRKIPTRYWVRLLGETRYRRVYSMVFSNSGSLYVVVNGNDVFLDDLALEMALGY